MCHGAGAGQERRARACLRAVCACPQWRRANRRPALRGGRQAVRRRNADCKGTDRGRPGDGWRKTRADTVYLAALEAMSPQPKLDLGRADFGSALRDAAALVTLASEGRAPQKTIDDAVLRIDSAGH